MKPKQKKINWKRKSIWSKTEQVGYNQAVTDYDAWILERLEYIFENSNTEWIFLEEIQKLISTIQKSQIRPG
uniref:Uncharacterized protein n=1 Tax=viral metagenome TaxID=1070528 RepID=A0A6M3JNA8_9ZZZZ